VKKTDLIKLRCTPSRKAELQREAAYRRITLTELIERALEYALNPPVVVLPDEGISALRPKPVPVAVVPECSAGGKACCTYPECNGGTTCSPRSAPADVINDDVSAQVTPATAVCPHGSPSPRLCWRCA